MAPIPPSNKMKVIFAVVVKEDTKPTFGLQNFIIWYILGNTLSNVLATLSDILNNVACIK